MLKSGPFLKVFIIIALGFSLSSLSACDEKPVQHLKLDNISSPEKAKSVFLTETLALKSKGALDQQAMHDIHLTTYSLEESIAYYANNATGEIQSLAKEMAIVVEEIHLNSENSRSEKTRKYLDQYFTLADSFEKLLK